MSEQSLIRRSAPYESDQYPKRDDSSKILDIAIFKYCL